MHFTSKYETARACPTLELHFRHSILHQHEAAAKPPGNLALRVTLAVAATGQWLTPDLARRFESVCNILWAPKGSVLAIFGASEPDCYLLDMQCCSKALVCHQACHDAIDGQSAPARHAGCKVCMLQGRAPGKLRPARQQMLCPSQKQTQMLQCQVVKIAAFLAKAWQVWRSHLTSIRCSIDQRPCKACTSDLHCESDSHHMACLGHANEG